MNLKRRLESDLDALYNEIAKGAQVRSRTKWISEGEKNTNLFFRTKKETSNK